MISPEKNREYLRFRTKLMQFLKEALEPRFSVKYDKRILHDPVEDAHKGPLCGQFEKPLFYVKDEKTHLDVAVVNFGYGGDVTVKSYSGEFDPFAQKFKEEYGKKCLFIDHNLETLIQLPATEEPEVYVDSKSALQAIRSMSVSLPNMLNLTMRQPGYTAKTQMYRHGGVILHLEQSDNPSKTIDVKLPVEITKATLCYMR